MPRKRCSRRAYDSGEGWLRACLLGLGPDRTVPLVMTSKVGRLDYLTKPLYTGSKLVEVVQGRCQDHVAQMLPAFCEG